MYTAPKAERFRLNAPLNVLDSASIDMEWEGFIDGEDEDQY